MLCVDETKGANSTCKRIRVACMPYNRTKQDTYNNVGQTDFPSLLTNRDKLVMQRECNGTDVLRMLDVTELGMRRRVPKYDVKFCGVCDKLAVLRQGNARVTVAFGN